MLQCEIACSPRFFRSSTTKVERPGGSFMAVAARKSKAPAQPKAAARSPKTAPASSNIATFTREEDLHAYREMLLIRRFEEKAGQMYGMGLIGGFCHLYIGQEAVV